MRGRLDVGGAERDRTADLLIANEALSQLSYGPAKAQWAIALRNPSASEAIYGPPPDAVKEAAKLGSPQRIQRCLAGDAKGMYT